MVTVRPHRRRRRWIGRIILLVLVVAVGIGGYLGVQGVVKNFGGPSCRAVASGQEVTFTPEQMANAATITAVAVRRGLPARAATIALATAIQESKLRNIRFGDRDSLGLFQQRPSQGWGTEEQILDPGGSLPRRPGLPARRGDDGPPGRDRDDRAGPGVRGQAHGTGQAPDRA